MATRWLEKFREYEGIKEIKGAEVHPKIAEWFTLCGLPNANDDTTPWCAVCVSGVLDEAGIEGPRSASSQAFLDWGEECEAEPGAVVIFRGHVAVVTEVEPELMIIGGNQSDGICEQPARYYGEPTGFRWPEHELEEAVEESEELEFAPEDPVPGVVSPPTFEGFKQSPIGQHMERLIKEALPNVHDLPPLISVEEVRDMFEKQAQLIKHIHSELAEANSARYNEIVNRLDDILEWIETRKAPKVTTGILQPKRKNKKLLR